MKMMMMLVPGECAGAAPSLATVGNKWPWQWRKTVDANCISAAQREHTAAGSCHQCSLTSYVPCMGHGLYS